MAAAITCLIGLAVAGAASSLSYAYNQTQNMSELLQSQRVAMSNMERVLRTGKLVVAVIPGGLIVWQGDANVNGSIDLNELVKIEFDSANHQIVQESLPGLATGLNPKLTLASANNYSTTKTSMDSAIRSTYMKSAVLATNVRGFEVKTNAASPLTTVVLIRVTTSQGTESVTVTNSIALRADSTGAVTYTHNVPILCLN